VGPRISLDAVAKRKIPSLCPESNPDRPGRSLVTIPTELSRFPFFVLFRADCVRQSSEAWFKSRIRDIWIRFTFLAGKYRKDVTPESY
jgi:hypothetical protein